MTHTVKKLLWMAGIFIVGLVGLLIADQLDFIDRIRSNVGFFASDSDVSPTERLADPVPTVQAAASVKPSASSAPTPEQNRARIQQSIDAKTRK